MGTGNLAPGTYQIVPSGIVQADAVPNYTIVYENGVLTVAGTPATPAVTVTNNCNGTSTLSTDAAGTLLWSNGATTQSITVAAAGVYSVTTTVNGCISAPGSGTAAPKTTPAQPSVSVANNCGSSTLSATTANANGNLLWSNGATTPSITVNSAGVYSVTVTVNGCSSPAAGATAAPKTVPVTPVVTVTNNCNGTSTLSTTASGSLLWSNGKTTPSITVTSAGTYTVKATVNGCTSAAGSGVAAPKTTPARPTITVVNNCGTSVLSTNASGSLLWSTGATTSSITVPGGTYTLTTTVNGCTSPAASALAFPKALPAAPTATVLQPTCTSPIGTIKVTSSTSGLKFSIDGSNYNNSNGVFAPVSPGTYNLTAKNSNNCISAPTVIVITARNNCASIGNFVFKDVNADGKQSSGEPGISGVTVKLLNSGGTVLATTTTSSGGVYGFSDLVAGTYKVQFITPAGYMPTISNTGSNDAIDSDPVNGVVSNIVLTQGQANTSVDAGYTVPVLALGNRVWYDANNNGSENTGEKGIKNVTVKLYKDDDNNNVADGAAIATKVTDADGYYSFTALAPGNYIVGAVLPAGYISSNVNGGDPDNNNNADDNGQVLSNGEIRGLAITLANGAETESSGNTNNTYDFGMLADCNCINTSGNLLTNGSFESGTAGWSVSTGSFTTGTGYVACGSKNGFNAASNNKTSTVYQDVNIAPGTTVTFSGFAGTHAAGLSCSPKISLVFRNASGTVLSQANVWVTHNVDLANGQLALYTLTATAPAGTAKVRVQTTITCNTMKMDAFCLRSSSVGSRSSVPIAKSLKQPANNSADEQPNLGLDVAVSPNPFDGFVNLAIMSDDILPVEIRILTMEGKLVTKQQAQANASIRITATNWKSGMYFVEVIQGSNRKIVKAIKVSN